MTQDTDPRLIHYVLTHPSFISLIRLDVLTHVLCMEDPQGRVWTCKGTVDDCITTALSELPLYE